MCKQCSGFKCFNKRPGICKHQTIKNLQNNILTWMQINVVSVHVPPTPTAVLHILNKNTVINFKTRLEVRDCLSRWFRCFASHQGIYRFPKNIFFDNLNDKTILFLPVWRQLRDSTPVLLKFIQSFMRGFYIYKIV